MVTRVDIEEAVNDLISFTKDLCESLCNGDADCIAKCHGARLREVADFISGINPDRTNPQQLKSMLSSFKRSRQG